MKITKEEIEHHASKMMINITEKEIKEIINDLEALSLEFDKIDSINGIKDVEPMTHTIDIPECILRSDIPIDSPPIEELFKNATHVNNREIEVPKVVG